jgi:radical SAM protein (TIGR01212 family)
MPGPKNSAADIDWWAAGASYNRYGRYLRQKFGGRVQRVSLDAGFTCPNVDGTVARGGCTFCDNRSFSPSRRIRLRGIERQLEHGMAALRRRYDDLVGFLAYFQPATNTYGAVDRLRDLYTSALDFPGVLGLCIGTRPDCLDNGVIDLLAELSSRAPLELELGMQTMHDASLRWMNRGHDHACTVTAMERLRARGITTGLHLMLGLPGEDWQAMMETADEVARLQPHSVKLHNLYAVQGTRLAEQLQRGEVALMEREDYVRTVVDFIERLPPQVVIERVSGDAPPSFLVGPAWCLEKPRLRADIESQFRQRGTRQGSRWVDGQPD